VRSLSVGEIEEDLYFPLQLYKNSQVEFS